MEKAPLLLLLLLLWLALARRLALLLLKGELHCLLLHELLMGACLARGVVEVQLLTRGTQFIAFLVVQLSTVRNAFIITWGSVYGVSSTLRALDP
jgi:hypothetical protein